VLDIGKTLGKGLIMQATDISIYEVPRCTAYEWPMDGLMCYEVLMQVPFKKSAA
jgi:hypothetical protein